MAAPTRCPRCKLEWGVEKVYDAKPKEGATPAQPARWRCLACLHRFDEAAD